MAVGSQDMIITGSRDKTIKLWGENSGAYEAVSTLVSVALSESRNKASAFLVLLLEHVELA